MNIRKNTTFAGYKGGSEGRHFQKIAIKIFFPDLMGGRGVFKKILNFPDLRTFKVLQIGRAGGSVEKPGK